MERRDCPKEQMIEAVYKKQILANTHTLSKPISVNDYFDSMLMFLLALSPILQHYRGIIANPSLIIISSLAIVAFFRIIPRIIFFNIGFALLISYGLFAAFIHGITASHFLREMVQIVLFLAIGNGLFDIMKLRLYSRIIAIIATILIMVQYFTFYGLGFHLQLVATDLLNPTNSQWFALVQTGTIGVTGTKLAFYRPSAFFLEPSHFAIYCIPVIVTTLFSSTGDNRKERIIALFVSFGIFLSTSGMGIGIVVMCWAVYLSFFYGKHGKTRWIKIKDAINTRSLTLMVCLVILIVILYSNVPFFRQSMNRIFMASEGESMSAIEGRTSTGLQSIKMLTGTRLLIGFGDIYDVSNWNMATMFFVIFRFGWIGCVLFFSFYIYSFFKLEREAYCLSAIVCLLSLFTVHMFGAYYKIYYTSIILYGYEQCRQEGLKSKFIRYSRGNLARNNAL